jgi:signal transduction histidine kinase
MTKDIVGFLAWLGGGSVMLFASQELQAPAIWLLVLGLMVFSFDSLILSSWGKTNSRVAPLAALALLFSGGMGFVVASVALLAGGLLICFSWRSRKMIPGDLCRSLGPLGAAPAQGLDLPEPFPQLAVVVGFLVLSLVLEPRRFALRPTLLGLFCAPWIALSCYVLGQVAPWSLLLMVPVLVGLSRGKDDMFPMLLKLRKALLLTQEQVKVEAERARRFHDILHAANLMARTLKPEDLRKALAQAAERTGAEGVTVYLPGEKRPRCQGIELLDGKARLAYSGEEDQAIRDQLEILGRVFSTCWENSELHQQVLEALEETRRSQAQLVESSRLAAMGLMAAGVAHEVNTPLGAIQLSNELAQKCLTRMPDAVPKHLASIDRATERAQKAVERILYYAKPMGEEQRETFTIAGVVEDALALLSHRVDRAKSEIHTEVPTGLELTGERQAFYSLVFNLILNGLEEVQSAETAVVWIRCGETADKIVVEVEDSGRGVPPEVRDNIFEPFFTTRPSGEGTGLGLHLARTAAELFGGTLTLVSPRQQGAIFRAEFPKE